MNSRRLMLDPKISGERIIGTKPTVLIGPNRHRCWNGRGVLARWRLDPDQNRDQRGAQTASRRMKTSEEPMWLMGTPGSLIFIGLVAVMVAVSLKLLA